MSILKLTSLAAFVAMVSVGCASSGSASNEGNSRSTVTALSFGPETRPSQLAKWPSDYNVRVIETYTFAAPEPGVTVAANAPTFSADLPPGTVFVEAAGAEGEAKARRVVQHSPNPR